MARVNEGYKDFNCYSMLEIHYSALPNEIKSAWRVQSLKHHPDVGGSLERQIKINLAYEVLRDPITRQSHDFFWLKKTHSHSNTNTKQNSSAHHKPDNNKSGGFSQKPSSDEPLSGFKIRLAKAIADEKASIWRDQQKKEKERFDSYLKKTEEGKKSVRSMVLWTCALGIAAIYLPFLWILTAITAYTAYSKRKEINIDGKTFSLADEKIHDHLRQHARYTAAENCHQEAKRLEEYSSYFSSLLQIILRPFSFDDSEEQVARRLTISLFLMGYTPLSYHSDERMLLFQDGDEKLVIRFRHRSGNALNITYVEKLRYMMMATKATQGFIFCSPGLSGNAAQFAHKNGIKYYTLESMNEWINAITHSTHRGPSGDIFKNLTALTRFLNGLSPQMGYSRSYGRKRRRY